MNHFLRVPAGIGALLFSVSVVAAAQEPAPYELGDVMPRRKIVRSLQLKEFGEPNSKIASVKCASDSVTILNPQKAGFTAANSEIAIEFIGKKPGSFSTEIVVEYQTTDPLIKKSESLILRANVVDPALKYLIHPEALLSESGEIVYVDLRRAADYAILHIPNSQNMSAYLLQTREDLKKKKVVMVHDGVSDAELLDRCADLTAKGFQSVRLLCGGIRSWQLNRGPLELSRKPSLSEWEVPSSKVEAFSKANGGMVIYIFKGALPIDPEGIDSFKIPLAKLEARLTNYLDRTRPNSMEAQRVLVVSEDGTDYEAFENALKGKQLPAVYFLRGGLASFKAWRVANKIPIQLVKTASSESLKSGAMTPVARGTGGCCGN